MLQTKKLCEMQDLIEDAKRKREGRVEAQSFVEVFLDEIEKNGGKDESVVTSKGILVDFKPKSLFNVFGPSWPVLNLNC